MNLTKPNACLNPPEFEYQDAIVASKGNELLLKKFSKCYYYDKLMICIFGYKYMIRFISKLDSNNIVFH
jgi:hypothetical protein